MRYNGALQSDDGLAFFQCVSNPGFDRHPGWYRVFRRAKTSAAMKERTSTGPKELHWRPRRLLVSSPDTKHVRQHESRLDPRESSVCGESSRKEQTVVDYTFTSRPMSVEEATGSVATF